MANYDSSDDSEEYQSLATQRPSPGYGTVGSRSELLNISGGFSYVNAGEYIPQPRRKLALILIQLCHFCLWTAAFASLYWLPRFVHLNQAPDDYYLADLTVILFYCTGWVSGVLTDSCISKMPALIFSVVYSVAGISGCLFIIHYRKAPGDISPRPTLQPGYDILYYVLLVSTAVIMPIISILLPTVGADQLPLDDRHGVRKFYTWFYFIRKIAELINHSFFLIMINLKTDIIDQEVPWVVFMFVFCGCGLILTFLVVLPQLTRRVHADISVVKDGCGILVQAIQRRKMRPEGDNMLSGAARRNGGDYHNSAVNERVKMIKFAVTLLLLIPVAFSAAPPPYVDYNPNREGCDPNPTDNNMTRMYGVQEAMYVTKCCSTAVGVVLLYCICHAVSFSRFKRPTLFARLIAGHVTMIIATIISLITYFTKTCNQYYKAIPYLLNGLTDALIYTTGFELTFISAPRSMQGTVMGMFYLVPGIAYSLAMTTDHFLISHPVFARDWVWGSGIFGNVLGIILLSVVHKCFDLGLSVY